MASRGTMPETMRAARLHGLNMPIQVDDVPVPDIGEGDVLVQIKVCGLNGGDSHLLAGDVRLRPREGSEAIPDLPMTISHDGAGILAKVGRNVKGFKEGDRTLINARLTCGFCKFCRSGREHLCQLHRLMGFLTYASAYGGDPNIFAPYKDGLCAEYARVPATNIFPLPDAIDFEEVGDFGLLGVAYHGVKMAGIGPGDAVIITGATGSTGVCAVACARLFGATRIICIARNEERLKRLKEIAPDHIETISVPREPIREKVRQCTDGRGARVLLDFTPQASDTTEQAIYSLERGGQAILLGGNTEELRVSYRYLMINAIEIRGSKGFFHEDVPVLLDLMEHKALDLSFIQHCKFPIDRINEALKKLVDKGPHLVWVMVQPTGSND